MEILSIFNSNGNITTKTAVRGYECVNDEYYLSSHVFIYNSNNEFLLQKRASNKEFRPDEWEILMEHETVGENGMQTAKRGLFEELGLSYNDTDFEFLAQIKCERYNDLIDIYFLKTNINISKLNIEQDELSDIKWVSKEEILDLVKNMTSYRPKKYIDVVYDYIQKL